MLTPAVVGAGFRVTVGPTTAALDPTDAGTATNHSRPATSGFERKLAGEEGEGTVSSMEANGTPREGEIQEEPHHCKKQQSLDHSQ